MILLRKKNLNGFGGLGWSRSLETVKKKEGKRVLEAALIVVSAGEVESYGGKSKCPVVFVEV